MCCLLLVGNLSLHAIDFAFTISMYAIQDTHKAFVSCCAKVNKCSLNIIHVIRLFHHVDAWCLPSSVCDFKTQDQLAYSTGR